MHPPREAARPVLWAATEAVMLSLCSAVFLSLVPGSDRCLATELSGFVSVA